jgi:hypothetical protein
MANTAYNEGLKLSANLLNSAANTRFAVGVVGPIVAAFFSQSIDNRLLIVSITVWFGAMVLLHTAAPLRHERTSR